MKKKKALQRILNTYRLDDGIDRSGQARRYKGNTYRPIYDISFHIGIYLQSADALRKPKKT